MRFQRAMLRKVARRSTGSADQGLRFTAVELPRGFLHQIKVKKPLKGYPQAFASRRFWFHLPAD
jgi:hypothetical protein